MKAPAVDGTREKLAFWITGAAVVGVTLAALLAIWLAAAGAGRAEMARLVFASILPLFGTWVGTVLAFYFAKENLQAATESTIRLAGRRDPATPVSEAMVPRSKIRSHDLGADEDAGTLLVATLLSEMRAAGFRRIPILTAAEAVSYVVHDSTIAKFAEEKGKRPGQLDAEPFSELLNFATLRAQVEAIGVVGAEADLGQARSAMRSVAACNDVFVTKYGRRGDPVVGWLTNTELAGIEDS